jgi:drug/metabolite transporter (DMT)-like permease
MSTLVFAVVLSGALLHATWNAIVKSAHDKFLTTIMVTAAAALIAAVLLPFLRLPERASWPYIGDSMVLQVVYFVLVARTYRIADMSLTYPLMRGTAPFLVALVTVFRLGDSLSLTEWCGVIGICVGVFSMTLSSNLHQPKGIYLALLNALVIAAYTLVDGIGVRLSGAAASYTLSIFLLTGIPFTVWALAARSSSFVPYVMRHWRLGIAGGMGATASYALALWAMTVAPVAVVAALRETSILFATLIAGFILKERVGVRRIIPVCIIAASAAALRLA